jgi:hypothetical protein
MFIRSVIISFILLTSIKESTGQNNLQELFIDNIPFSCKDSFETSVRLRKLNNVIGLQGSIRWDSTALALYAVKAGTSIIPLDSSNMNLANAARGLISFLWFDNSIAGLDPADSSVLFTLKFKKKADAEGKQFISWSDQPTPREIDTLDISGIPQKNNQAIFSDGSIRTTYEYVFTGNGIWSDANNWQDKRIPPALLSDCEVIIISHSHSGTCDLNTPQNMSKGSKIRIKPGCRLNISGYLQ